MREERGPLLPKGWYMGASVATKEDLEFPRPMHVMGIEGGEPLKKIEYFRDCSILDGRRDPRSFELNAMFAFTQFDTRGDTKSNQLLKIKEGNLPSFNQNNVKLALVDVSKFTPPQKKPPSAKKKKQVREPRLLQLQLLQKPHYLITTLLMLKRMHRRLRLFLHCHLKLL